MRSEADAWTPFKPRTLPRLKPSGLRDILLFGTTRLHPEIFELDMRCESVPSPSTRVGTQEISGLVAPTGSEPAPRGLGIRCRLFVFVQS